MSTAAKYLWPIPNKGLSKRLHRLTQPTLLIWGAQDAICPPAYGVDFMDVLAHATLHLVPRAAHMVHVEQPDAVAELVAGFVSAE